MPPLCRRHRLHQRHGATTSTRLRLSPRYAFPTRSSAPTAQAPAATPYGARATLTVPRPDGAPSRWPGGTATARARRRPARAASYDLYRGFFSAAAAPLGRRLRASWDLRERAAPPRSSADAAGLRSSRACPLRRVASGRIEHAIRVTSRAPAPLVHPASSLRRRHASPARRHGDSAAAKASYGLAAQRGARLSPSPKRYGRIVADNGSNWFSAPSDGAWDDRTEQLKGSPAPLRGLAHAARATPASRPADHDAAKRAWRRTRVRRSPPPPPTSSGPARTSITSVPEARSGPRRRTTSSSPTLASATTPALPAAARRHRRCGRGGGRSTRSQRSRSRFGRARRAAPPPPHHGRRLPAPAGDLGDLGSVLHRAVDDENVASRISSGAGRIGRAALLAATTARQHGECPRRCPDRRPPRRSGDVGPRSCTIGQLQRPSPKLPRPSGLQARPALAS